MHSVDRNNTMDPKLIPLYQLTIMKRLLVVTVLVFTHFCSFGQSAPKADPKDVASKDAIIDALYDVISGPAGQKRDWDRMRSLFIPEGRLMPSGQAPSGDTAYQIWTVDDYVTRAGKNLEERGFFEQEIARKVEQFGTIAHVFSTYESRQKANDPSPFSRGINSIQLLKGQDRWFIVSVFWMGENPNFPLPERYLKN